jgi:endonuclease YncB( thermonuclease family)
MPGRILALAVALAFPLGCDGTPTSGNGTVRTVVDGDTIVLTDARHVRLVQLDAPETNEGECYAWPAKRALEALIPGGTHIRVETDPALDQEDEFGRVLAYVHTDGTNVNLDLVRRGAAAPWFYDGDRGRHATELLAAARDAKRRRRGLWRTCPETVLDPLHAVETRP